MPHQDKSQKCYLDQGINLEWPKHNETVYVIGWVRKKVTMLKSLCLQENP